MKITIFALKYYQQSMSLKTIYAMAKEKVADFLTKESAKKNKAPKTTKEKKVKTELSEPVKPELEDLTLKKEIKEEEREVAEVIVVKTPSEEVEAIVVETPSEEEFISPAPATVVFSKAAPVSVPKNPDAMDRMVESLNKNLKAYGKPMTKRGVEDMLKLTPRNVPYFITPVYEAGTFTIEVSDGNKKVSTRPHPLFV